MHIRKKQRIYAIILVLIGVGIATALTLTALREQVTFFYAPSDILGAEARPVPEGRPFRLGGLVAIDSVDREGQILHFTVTDNAYDIAVTYDGIVPDLFREGQGVVAMGELDENGVFVANKLLAKHDENYMPPEVKKALENAHEEGVSGQP